MTIFFHTLLAPLAWTAGFSMGLWHRRRALAAVGRTWVQRHGLLTALLTLLLVWSVLWSVVAPGLPADVAYYLLGGLLTWALTAHCLMADNVMWGEDEHDAMDYACLLLASSILACVWPVFLPLGLLAKGLAWLLHD
jgi:hypothetical protein